MNILSLQEFYLQTLCAVIKAEKYEPALQEVGPGVGQIWAIRQNSTGAAFRIAFKFGADSVTFGAVARGNQEERQLVREIPYFDGMDDYMKALQKFLRADLLAAPRKAA